MRVLVVDDHEVVRRGVVSLLQARPDCTVCGEASDGKEAVEKARSLKPDIIIMDVSMPALNGIDATRALRSVVPTSEVIVLSQHDSPEMARQAFKAGARGYVIKSSVSQNLMAALDKVSRHESFFDPAISEISGVLDVQEILQRTATLEQSLRESEQVYRSTFELAAVGVAHVSPDGRWLRANKKLSEIIGYSEPELMQLNFQQLTCPDDLPAEIAATEKILNGELNTFAIEKRYIRRDKSLVWVNLTVSAVRDVAGRLKHFIAVVEDITGRREADEIRARLAAIVESSDDAIVSKDLNGIITSWNNGAFEIFGYTAEEAVGKSITIIIPPDFKRESQILARLRKGERIDHFETIRMNKAGARINVSLTISPVRDSRGTIIGASKIARDITERKRVEAALQESQTQLALALESSRTAMFDWDVLEKRGAWNPQMASIYGFNPSGKYITAEEWRSLFHPDDADRLSQEAERIWREQDQFQFEYRAIRPDGDMRWILSHGRIVRDADGVCIRMIGTHTDITERKQFEEAERVRELTGKLLHAQDAERRRIARELHDSAGQIVAALQMNLIPIEDEAATFNLEFARGIHESLELIQQLSAELRTVSYLLHPPLLDEAGLPSALRWYIEGFAERSKIDVHLEIDPELGRLPQDMEMTVFRVIQECLTNIHRHSGSKDADIRILGSANEVRLEVRDYGKGMGSLDRSGAPVLKYGVGIQGMRERVRQLNGQFEIKSQAEGTTVSARFPLVNVAQPVA